ncbi:MAG TPA: aldo/keto reductase, partial [Candidatus Acidoferrum sp.]|nr:aldo/keto reductase [Candidatus Acidoferrum sp.]
IAMQIEYSLIERSVERELVPVAKALNIGLTAWSPLSGGVLSGKYHGKDAGKDAKEQGRMSSDMMKDFKPDEQRADRIVTALKTVSGEVGRSVAQVALAWLRYRAVPVIPILGARKLSQLQDNLASLDLVLSPEQVNKLDDASKIDLGFPYSMYERGLVRNIAYGGMRDQIIA